MFLAQIGLTVFFFSVIQYIMSRARDDNEACLVLEQHTEVILKCWLTVFKYTCVSNQNW